METGMKWLLTGLTVVAILTPGTVMAEYVQQGAPRGIKGVRYFFARAVFLVGDWFSVGVNRLCRDGSVWRWVAMCITF